MSFQVVVDCRDPHPLADWWAETLGWQVEPSDPDFIRSMVEQGHATDADTTTHRGVLVWASGAAIVHPDGAGPGSRVLFQVVPEGKTVKNRLHLDVRVPSGQAPDDVVARLLERGATFLHTGTEGPQTRWTTLADPEGNEFCVA